MLQTKFWDFDGTPETDSIMFPNITGKIITKRRIYALYYIIKCYFMKRTTLTTTNMDQVWFFCVSRLHVSM